MFSGVYSGAVSLGKLPACKMVFNKDRLLLHSLILSQCQCHYSCLLRQKSDCLHKNTLIAPFECGQRLVYLQDFTKETAQRCKNIFVTVALFR